VLGSSRVALAQATARFADAPTPSPPSVAPSAASPAAPPATQVPLAPEPIQPPTPDGASASTPQAGFTRRLAVSHLERAKVLEARGDIPQALREYTESIAVDSTLGDAYLRLGALRARMGEPREAELVFSAALALPEARAKAFLERSHLRRNAGSNALALSDLESAVELDDDRTLLVELAQDYVELHAWSAALAVFRRVVASAAAKSARKSTTGWPAPCAASHATKPPRFGHKPRNPNARPSK
jgi:hypothetical protein